MVMDPDSLVCPTVTFTWHQGDDVHRGISTLAVGRYIQTTLIQIDVGSKISSYVTNRLSVCQLVP